MTVKSSHNNNDQLDQQMLELVYELLPADEAAALRGRIAGEPAAAAAFERARRAAGVFAAAAKWQEAPIAAETLRAAVEHTECGMQNDECRMQNDERGATNSALCTLHSALDRSHSPLQQDPLASLRRALQWAVGIAATVLFAFLLGGYLHHRGRMSDVVARHLRVTVTGPSQLVAGAENEFQIKTTDVLGEPQSVKLQCTFFDLAGKKVLSEQAQTDGNGWYELLIPSDARVAAAGRLEVLAFHRDEAYRQEAAVPVAPYRFLTRLATDKPLYRPGEVVRFRSVTLGRFGLDAPADFPVHFEVLDPAGAVVAGSQHQGITQRGVGNGEFALSPDRPGGEYQLVAKSLDGAFPEEKRKFFVREYRTPELKKELEFTRDSYTPGDRVIADLAVNKAKGGPAAEAQLTITATVDGQAVHQATQKASASGTYRVEFALPAEIAKGDAQLSIQCDDGGVRETIAKTIPINLGKVELKFYPEGGDMVAGLANRVYFAAKNPLGKPVHVEGTIVDDGGQQVASFETKHKGMGSFTFTPAGQETYRVRVTKPAGVKSESTLPAVNEERFVVLSTGAGVCEAGKPIEAKFLCPTAGVPLVCAAYCRGMQVGQEMLTTKAGENKVSLELSPEASGVVRLTVYDYSEQKTVGTDADAVAASVDASAAAGESKPAEAAKPAADAKVTENTTPAADVKPADDATPAVTAKLAKSAKPPMPRAIAERLVFRKPDRRLQVRVADHSEQYAPGEKVDLSLIAMNESGEPAKSAVLGLAVVDDSLLKLADDDSPGMSTHFYLTSEVEKPEDLEKADFYLSDDAKADEALDLLLGTQGWRRFVERSLEELHEKAKEAGQPVKSATADLPQARPEEPIERLLALGGAALPPTVLDNLGEIRPQYERARERVEEEHRAAVGQLGRAAIWGGLLLGGLLIAVNAAPLLRRRDWSREWSWLAASRRWGPALVAAGLCVLFGVLWSPAMSRAPRSDLVALQEFKLKPVPVETRFDATQADGDIKLTEWDRDDALLFRRYGENSARTHWYFAAPNDWSEMDLAARMPQYNLAFGMGDAYRGERFFKLAQNGGFAYDFDARYRHMMLPNQWGTMPWRKNGGELDHIVVPRGYAFIENFSDVDNLAKLGTHRFKHGYMYIEDGKAPTVAFLYDPTPQNPLELRAGLEALKQQIEQFRFPVREYAHVHTAGEPGVRSDFAETVCWHPLLVTDENGRASVKFDLSDSVTSYRVLAEAHDGAGRIGTGDGELFARLPFTVEPKLPLEVNAGDRLDIAVGVSNDSARELATVLSCSIASGEAQSLLKLADAAEQRLVVAPTQRARRHFTLDVVGQKGTAEIEVRGTAEAHADAKRQTIRVVPPGFPVAESYAGRINGPQEVTIDVPESIVPGTLEVTLSAYPSTIATLQSGLDGILREPSGCFEQASSSNYPNLLLLQYLEENKVSQPELTRRGKEFLQAGYAKLTGYECKSHGFEWFGADPGHEALTAYGLLEFRDMAKVHDVDRALLDRTAEWLLARRDGNGGFQRNTKKLDGFGSAPDPITNAYIVWALTESGQDGIDAEVSRTIEHARSSDDAYEVALAAASAVNAKRESDGRALLGKLAALAQADGKLVGKEGSITRSGGEALAIETTALAALAWLKLPEFREQANRAIEWIVRNRSGNGGFGSTQATILALKALVEDAKVNRGSVTAGELVVKHGDRVIGTQAFGADHVSTIKLAGFEGELATGENKLALSLTGENQMPYTIDVSYRARQPHSHADCAVELTTKLAANEIKAGETVALEAELVNKTDQGQPMTVAILGLPAGLQPRADQLEELKKAGTIDYYETRAREVICYWRSLAPKKRVTLKLDLVAEWPGKYTAPASRAYLYYTAEQKHWVEPVAVEIAR